MTFLIKVIVLSRIHMYKLAVARKQATLSKLGDIPRQCLVEKQVCLESKMERAILQKTLEMYFPSRGGRGPSAMQSLVGTVGIKSARRTMRLVQPRRLVILKIRFVNIIFFDE